jgi:hypothetical protein
MPWYRILNRFVLLLSLIWAGYFAAIGEIATAIAMFGLWAIVRASVLITDVFYTFVAGETLIKVSRKYRTPGGVNKTDWQNAKNTEYHRTFLSFDATWVGSNFGGLIGQGLKRRQSKIDGFDDVLEQETKNS